MKKSKKFIALLVALTMAATMSLVTSASLCVNSQNFGELADYGTYIYGMAETYCPTHSYVCADVTLYSNGSALGSGWGQSYSNLARAYTNTFYQTAFGCFVSVGGDCLG